VGVRPGNADPPDRDAGRPPATGHRWDSTDRPHPDRHLAHREPTNVVATRAVQVLRLPS